MPPAASRGGRAVAALASAALVLAGLTLAATPASAIAVAPLGCYDTSPVTGYTVINLTYSGATQTGNIPAGVTSVSVDICGAAGGGAQGNNGPLLGGNGGQTVTTLSLQGPTTLDV